jgi:transcriptional regulator GlxA family with amidase domain
MSVSRAKLYRKIKKLTGMTPSAYIREARFRRARKLLEERRHPTVKAVALSVGFKQVKNFSQQYKKRYGRLPSKYLS